MNALLASALKHRVLMLVLFMMMVTGGIIAFRELNIEAYPDPTPPMVDVITQSPGLSAEEIERYITIPIETQIAGLPNLTLDPHDFAVRSLRREAAVHVRLHLRRGTAAGAQSAVAAAASAEQCAAADFAGQPDRRDLPLPARRPARTTACSISRRCRTGCCSAASARYPA